MWINRFKYGDPDDLEYQKQIIDTFVNSVYVYDDRLVMTYNYKDGIETISLDAVHQAFGSDLSSDAPPRNQSEMTGFFRILKEICKNPSVNPAKLIPPFATYRNSYRN